LCKAERYRETVNVKDDVLFQGDLASHD